MTLLLYALLAFLPSSWASYTLRVYRDNIFPALCLLFFAGMAGAALRAVFYTRQQAPIWPWLLAAGVGLACGYLNREDAGLFLLPFAIAATLCMLVVLLHRRRWLCAAAQVIPYAVLAAGVGIFCALNQHWYGVWGLSDFSEGSFADAMGAMTRVATDSDEPLLSVPADAREKLYAEIPQLQCLQYWLEEDPQLQNDFRDPELDDYRAGSFYWAIRRAAQYEGIYADAATADAYWQSVADAINAACDNGTLPARSGKRSATSQPHPCAVCTACNPGSCQERPLGPDLPGLPRPITRPCALSGPPRTLPNGLPTCTVTLIMPLKRARIRPTMRRCKSWPTARLAYCAACTRCCCRWPLCGLWCGICAHCPWFCAAARQGQHCLGCCCLACWLWQPCAAA